MVPLAPKPDDGRRNRIRHNLGILLKLETIALQHRIDIETTAAAKYYPFATVPNILNGFESLLLVTIDIVTYPRLLHIDQMIRDGVPIILILRQILSRPDVHAAEHLTGIGTHNLAA